MEKDLHRPRFPFLAKSCQMILTAYLHTCWARGQLQNTCSTDSTDLYPKPTMGATLVNLHQDFTAPIVNCHCLMDNWSEECRLFLCLSFVPNGIPPGGGGGGNFIPPLVQDWLLQAYLLSDPLPPFFGRVSEEGGDLWPPLASGVESKLIEFPKKQIEPSFATTSSEPINPYAYHLTTESCWWWCILSVRFNLHEGEILWSHYRFGKSAHKFGTKMNRSRAKFLEITRVDNPFQ